jgi:decaprenylphospho-beta-D-erythro-pentofuranosid-2-ulose 2-reductase
LKKIIIIGANSAIAEQCGRLWAARGDSLCLVARNQVRLDTLKNDLIIRGANQVATYTMDVNDYSSHTKMLDYAIKVLDGFDTVFIAHGTLSNQKACEQNVQLMIQEMNTNAISTIALLNHVANRFERKGEGTIAVIASVAGDRGRASNYVYGSAKAMLIAFTSGLRQRLYQSNVAVVTIKPGFVDTPMTAEFKKGLLWVKPDLVAIKIVKAVDRRKKEVYVPSFWWIIALIIKSMPTTVFDRLKL